MTIRILHGDCREVMKTLPDESVDCCVTSPPYWGLRSYLPDGHPNKHLEIGSEPTLDAWVSTMVEVFREVRRVLRPDGTLWLNLGDAYAGSGRGGNIGNDSSGLAGKQTDHCRKARASRMVSDHQRSNCPAVRGSRLPAGFHADVVNAGQSGRAWTPPPPGLKPKDLMGQPWRVAFALQADGWWLRQDIVWHKPNPMPESVRDRCTKAHEYVFLLSKSEKYFYDFEAMQEPVSASTHARLSQDLENQLGSERAHAGAKANGRMKAVGRGTGVGFGHGYDKNPKPRVKDRTPAGWATGTDRQHTELDGRFSQERKFAAGTKNNASFDAAMAVMPTMRNARSVWTINTHGFKGAHFATFPPELAERCVAGGCPPGGTVLDLFGGSGTVGLAADRQQKNAILIDLDERNIPMAQERIAADAPLFADVEAA